MKVREVAPFCFYFKSANNIKESYRLLVNFLISKKWLNDRGDKRSPLSSFYSDENGECHILLESDMVSDEFIELTNEMYETLVSETSIEYIKAGFYPATEGIIYNNVDKYSQYQTIYIQELSKGDMMVVFKR